MHLIDSLNHPHIHAIAVVICVGIAALSFFTVVELLVTISLAVRRSGEMTRQVLRRRLKVICAFWALTGLSGSLSIALEVDIHSFRSFLVGELSVSTGIMLFTLVFGALASAIAVGSGDSNEEDGYWQRNSAFESDVHRPTVHEQDDHWGGRYAFDNDADRSIINPASGYLMCGSVDIAGNMYGTCMHHIGDY